jgi:hypothetical protein
MHGQTMRSPTATYPTPPTPTPFHGNAVLATVRLQLPQTSGFVWRWPLIFFFFVCLFVFRAFQLSGQKSIFPSNPLK